MSAHTPGPWRMERGWGPRTVAALSVAAPHLVSVNVSEGQVPLGLETAEANARLIAAAPELLEALRYLLLVTEGAEMLLTGEAMGPRHLGEADHEFMRQARAAIAKAEGR